MDFSDDDSVDDPHYEPSDESDYTESSDSESIDIRIPPISARRNSTFAEDLLPPLPNIQRRRTPRTLVEEPPRDEVPSTSGTTSVDMTEAEWLHQKLTNIQWENPTHEDPQTIDYTVAYYGIKDIYSGILANAKPIDYFDSFLTHDILQLITDQTNLYATQYLSSTDATPSSRLHAWTPATLDEMRKFLALVGWMGLVKLPSIKDYWRFHPLYGIPLARKVMPRNRFELMLKFLHFSDNLNANIDDRLYKIREVMDKFVQNYQKYYIPGEKICVDESLVAWRGRLLFRQYIPNKAAKYGIKVFKLCTDKGYTWNFTIYCGKSRDRETEVSEKTVMTLAEGLLDEGRTLYTDNYYTSIPLAYRLRRRKTHLVGTLRSNRKHLPKDIMNMKLKRSEMCAKQTSDGIVVTKWRDKRDVRMLSTKTSGLKTVPYQNRNMTVSMKPECIVDYNNGKSSIDLSDQMATYGSALRRCTKWYRKLFIEILWGTSLVNAHFLYNLNTIQKKLTITEFRESVIQDMIEKGPESVGNEQSTSTPIPRRVSAPKHYLIKIKDGEKMIRGRCSECYKKYGRDGVLVDGKKIRAKQVSTKCSECNSFMCQLCFNAHH